MKELLFSITRNDFDITYFSGRGAGGQHRNKHQNCVRIKHLATGIIKTGQAERSRIQNTRVAFMSIVNDPKFKLYIRQRASGELLRQEEIEKKVEGAMREENLKIEYL